MIASIKKFLTDEEGATMAEYAIILAVLAVGAYTVFGQLGTAVVGKVTEAKTAVQGSTAAP